VLGKGRLCSAKLLLRGNPKFKIQNQEHELMLSPGVSSSLSTAVMAGAPVHGWESNYFIK